MTKQDAIQKVEGAFPSIFSKEDVIDLIKQIDERNGGINQHTLLSRIRTAVNDAVDGLSTDDVVDVDDARYDIRNGNEVYVTDIAINTDSIVSEIMDGIKSAIEEFIEDEQAAE